MDWEGADQPPSLKSTKVIEKPVDHLDLSQPKSNQSLLSPRWHFEGKPQFSPIPLLCFLYTPSAEVFVSFPCETVGLFQRLKRSVCLLRVKAEGLRGSESGTGGRGLDRVAR